MLKEAEAAKAEEEKVKKESREAAKKAAKEAEAAKEQEKKAEEPAREAAPVKSAPKSKGGTASSRKTGKTSKRK